MHNSIAILLPVYNGIKYVEEQINSILKQDYRDWTLYIRDDGSSDGTLDLIRNRFQAHKNITITGDRQGNLGVRRNYEILMSLADADYYMFADQDDIWLEHKISRSIDEIKKMESSAGKEKALLVHSDLFIADKDMKITSRSYYRYWGERPSGKLNKILMRCEVTGCTMLINHRMKELYLKSTNKELSSSKYVLHDHWMSVLASIFGLSSFIDEQLMLYRRHEKNTSSVEKRGLLKKIAGLYDKIALLSNINRELASGLKSLSLTDNLINDYIALVENKTGLFKKAVLILKNKFFCDTMPHSILWLISLQYRSKH